MYVFFQSSCRNRQHGMCSCVGQFNVEALNVDTSEQFPCVLDGAPGAGKSQLIRFQVLGRISRGNSYIICLCMSVEVAHAAPAWRERGVDAPSNQQTLTAAANSVTAQGQEELTQALAYILNHINFFGFKRHTRDPRES